MIKCPRCQSQAIVKNGSIHNVKQKYAGKDCGCQFVENPHNTNQPIPQATIALIDKLLFEWMSLAAIRRATGVSASLLQRDVNKKYEQPPREVMVRKKSKRRLGNRDEVAARE